MYLSSEARKCPCVPLVVDVQFVVNSDGLRSSLLTMSGRECWKSSLEGTTMELEPGDRRA